jgi:hypothetical protein
LLSDNICGECPPSPTAADAVLGPATLTYSTKLIEKSKNTVKYRATFSDGPIILKQPYDF